MRKDDDDEEEDGLRLVVSESTSSSPPSTKEVDEASRTGDGGADLSPPLSLLAFNWLMLLVEEDGVRVH